MRKINVMITGAGAPGAPGVIKSLKKVSEREIKIIGIDQDHFNSVGRVLLDKFIEGPSALDPDFIEKVLDIGRNYPYFPRLS
jgi:carbamoyl-phosphate synthase large subunit